MSEENVVLLVDISPENLNIKKDALVNLLGYERNLDDEYLTNTIQSCINKSMPLLAPKGGYIIQKVLTTNWKAGNLEINSTELQVNKIISSQIKNADYIAIFIGTIGKELEKYSEFLFQNGEPLEGYIVNLIGSEAAESLAEIIHHKIEEKSKSEGLYCTNRFSPGYCNWNVNEQFKLFQFFPDNCCDIRLTPSALMNPVKSVSGIIGLGEKVSRKEYPCKICDENKCIYKNST